MNKENFYLKKNKKYTCKFLKIGLTKRTRCCGRTKPRRAATGTITEPVNHVRVMGGILLNH
jgi:hypothetical protein